MKDQVTLTLEEQRLTPTSFTNASNDSITFTVSLEENKISDCKASVIVCPDSVKLDDKRLRKVSNPKLTFARLLNKYYKKEYVGSSVHSTAIVSPDLKFYYPFKVGPYSVLGNADFGPNAIIGAHVYIGEVGAKFGCNLIIQPQATVGVDGLSHVRNEDDVYVDFPNIGSLIVGDNVWIASRVNIDRGTLDDTIIGDGVKISKCVNVGHNAKVGNHTFIAGNSNLGGGCEIGEFCFIGMGSIVRNKAKIGNNCTIGMGSIVTKDIPDNSIAYGNPCKVREVL